MYIQIKCRLKRISTCFKLYLSNSPETLKQTALWDWEKHPIIKLRDLRVRLNPLRDFKNKNNFPSALVMN